MNQNKNQMPYFIKSLQILLLSAMFVAVCISLAGAENRTRIKSFKPPASFDSGEVDIQREAARHFDVIGEIFIMIPKENRIVVYDVSFNLAPGARTSGIREGMYVGMKLNSNKEVVAIERLQRPNVR